MATAKKLTPVTTEKAEPCSKTEALEARVKELEAKVEALLFRVAPNDKWVSK